MRQVDVRWLVRSPRFPNSVVPARNQEHAAELVAAFRVRTAKHRMRAAWEYGTHIPGLNNSYRRIGP
jgi:hypothetical protein